MTRESGTQVMIVSKCLLDVCKVSLSKPFPSRCPNLDHRRVLSLTARAQSARDPRTMRSNKLARYKVHEGLVAPDTGKGTPSDAKHLS